ncbi:MAG: hypothetical protein AAF597_20170, partial [Bacteroidota bacterium]
WLYIGVTRRNTFIRFMDSSHEPATVVTLEYRKQEFPTQTPHPESYNPLDRVIALVRQKRQHGHRYDQEGGGHHRCRDRELTWTALMHFALRDQGSPTAHV